MIVPSGKKKLMKLQQNATLVEQDGQAQQTQYTTDPAEDGGSAMDWAGLQSSIDNPQERAEPVSQQDLEGAADGFEGVQFDGQGAEVGVPEGDDLGETGGSLRDAVFRILEELGVPKRQIMSMPDKVFNGKKSLSDNTLTGFFLIPTYVQGGQINQDQAEKIALQISRQFGLDSEITHEKNNFKISFRTQQLSQQDLMGNSFDDLGGPDSGKAMMQRAAQTQGEMIKTSRHELIDRLLEIKLGDNS